MKFSEEEFYIMVDQLLRAKPSFDMLCCIAEKELRQTIIYWCMIDPNLKGRDCEGDILQLVHIRLMKTTVDYFLPREGRDGPLNNDPGGFHSWIFEVARNIKRDFSKKLQMEAAKTKSIEGIDLKDFSYDDAEERIERLKEAFNIVLASDINVYKTLTWLAQYVFILQYNIPKFRTNDMIVDEFEKKH